LRVERYRVVQCFRSSTGTAAWDSVGVTGERAIAGRHRRAVDAAARAAIEAHERTLRHSS
jgi:hypothetical protein